ncbi:MAG: DDE-type integrase/transposase/recombinase [Candidatus Hodarchaeales archaeon]
MGKIHFKVVGLPHQEITRNIYISLDFPIHCPKCKTSGSNIIKDGRENKTKGKPQKYECKNCGKKFCTHTSLFFLEATQAVLTLAFNEVTRTRSSINEVATRYNMSASTLSDFVARIRGELVTKTDLVKKILARENKQMMTLLGPNKAIFIDETFLKIKGSTYYLIVAVNSEGIPLSWKLASSRKNDMIKGVMTELLSQYGIPGMVITDGNPTYKSVLTDLRYEGYHVIHIHKDKRNRIIIRKCSFEKETQNYTEELIGINHDVFATVGTKPIWYLSSQKRISKKGGKGGRPKGSKNRPKDQENHLAASNPQNSKHSSRSPRKKRGPKNVFHDGHLTEIRVDPDKLILEVISPLQGQLDASPVHLGAFDSSRIFSLLYPVLCEFAGQYISTNRIENLFSQFDYFFIPNGRRSVQSVTNEANSWLLSRLSFSLLFPLIYYIARSFSSRIGLFNLNKLLFPTHISVP